MLKRLSAAYAGGTIGALIDSINIWALGHFGITAKLGVTMRPSLSGAWLYPRLVWGGLWMLLLVLPVAEKRPALRGMLISLLPSAMMLLVVFPQQGKGYYGLGYGLLTPLLVIGLNLLYGLIAAYWYRSTAK